MDAGWLIVGVAAGIIFCVVSYLLSLATRNPDFEMDDYEETSGVINVKANNKAKSDADIAARLREQEDDGA